MHMNIEHALREKLDVCRIQVRSAISNAHFHCDKYSFGTLNWWVIVENPE